MALYSILAQSLNLTFGLGRLFNLAHVASYSLGAYATAILSTDWQASFWVCITVSMLISGLFSLTLGAIALRLSTDYFAIGTLAFSSVVCAILINWKDFTRGVLGIPGIPRPELFGIDFYQNVNFLLLITIFAFLINIIFYILQRGQFGRTLRALAEFEHAASSLGKDTRTVRTLSFVVSSAAAGLAGSFFAYYMNYIDPSSFSLAEMVFILTVVIVGQPGSFFGAIGASILLLLIPEVLRFIEISPAHLGPTRQLLYATILFHIVWIKRDSLFPQQRQV
jgi:branched-chain amino acid transport system permease protein